MANTHDADELTTEDAAEHLRRLRDTLGPDQLREAFETCGGLMDHEENRLRQALEVLGSRRSAEILGVEVPDEGLPGEQVTIGGEPASERVSEERAEPVPEGMASLGEFDRDEGDDNSKEDEPEIGRRAGRRRPGQDEIDEFRVRDEPPRKLNGWTWVPQEVRIGNRRHDENAWTWETSDGHLRIRLNPPFNEGGKWAVELADDRIKGFSATDIFTRMPGAERRYDRQKEATEAAIRWMARHPAERSQHPFFDERIHDTPVGWESSHTVHQREERITFSLRDAELSPPDVIEEFKIEGFHRGDRYIIQTGSTVRGLEHWDPDSHYPDPGQEVTRDTALDAATRFMERNTFRERLEEFMGLSEEERAEQRIRRIIEEAGPEEVRKVLDPEEVGRLGMALMEFKDAADTVGEARILELIAEVETQNNGVFAEGDGEDDETISDGGAISDNVGRFTVTDPEYGVLEVEPGDTI